MMSKIIENNDIGTLYQCRELLSVDVDGVIELLNMDNYTSIPKCQNTIKPLARKQKYSELDVDTLAYLVLYAKKVTFAIRIEALIALLYGLTTSRLEIAFVDGRKMAKAYLDEFKVLATQEINRIHKKMDVDVLDEPTVDESIPVDEDTDIDLRYAMDKVDETKPVAKKPKTIVGQDGKKIRYMSPEDALKGLGIDDKTVEGWEV